jgi:hypothetical protein
MKNAENIDLSEIQKELDKLNMRELRSRFASYYTYTPQTRRKAHLVSKILWAIQRDALGDISAQARKTALSIANDRDVRERFPKPIIEVPLAAERTKSIAFKPSVEMTAGTILTRNHKGREVRVTVLDNGFEYDGRWFKSLSAIAREVTGTQWNGKLFFGLK